MPLDEYDPFEHEPIHVWFNLTYASYLVLPRSILQSMPLEWQRRFVKCLRELDAVSPDDVASSYWVRAHDENNRFTADTYARYDRGRRKVILKGIPCEHCGATDPIDAFDHSCQRPVTTSGGLDSSPDVKASASPMKRKLRARTVKGL